MVTYLWRYFHKYPQHNYKVKAKKIMPRIEIFLDYLVNTYFILNRSFEIVTSLMVSPFINV